MLDRLAPLAHSVGALVEPALHGVERMLVLPAVIQRCLAGVQRLLIAQVWQAFVQ